MHVLVKTRRPIKTARFCTLSATAPAKVRTERAAISKGSAFSMKLTFCALGVAVALLLCFACGRKSGVVRPEGVPVDAMFVNGVKGIGWWQQCSPAISGQVLDCRIWNRGGLVLEDEEFLPYDGGASPTIDELKISSDTTFAGPDRIYLSNGRVLLPRSRFDELKKFVDSLNGKAGAPR
jgi:hypothetical protein